MADAGTTAPEPSGSAAGGTTFHLEVCTLAGGCLATIPDARGSWQIGDVLSRLPEVLPGHRYQLLRGEAVLVPGTAIADWVHPVDGRACVTAVVAAAPTQDEQRQLDEALIEAAGELNVEKVRELLFLGADARFRSGGRTMTTALHKAVDALGSDPGHGKDGEKYKEEKEGKLQAVLGALLAADAQVDAGQHKRTTGETSSTCALHSAVQYGSLGAVRVLLDAGASIDAAAYERESAHGYAGWDSQCTALHVATEAGNVPLVALLLERGAGVNAVRWYVEQDEHGASTSTEVRETALHIAVVGGHQALVALLVQAGANPCVVRCRDSEATSTEELCAGNVGLLDALKADSSSAILAGGAFGAEVEAALAAIMKRRAAA